MFSKKIDLNYVIGLGRLRKFLKLCKGAVLRLEMPVNIILRLYKAGYLDSEL